MATTIEQQLALDETLVPSMQRLRIGRSNFRLPSDIQSKESTLQVIYDVLRRCPFFKAFLVTADVPEIYMQEFWATAYVHQHSIRFKLDTKSTSSTWKHLGTCFISVLGFLANPVMSYPLKRRFCSFLVINKCLTGKSSGFDSFRDDMIFSTIKVVSRHLNTQQYGVMLPIELTNDEIRNTKAYKEYYACATREAAHKPKVSARRKRSGSDTSITPTTAITTPTTTVVVAPRLTAAAKGKQPAKAKSPSDPSKVARTEAQQLKIVLRRSRQQTHISQLGGSGTDEGTDVDAQEKDRDDDEGEDKDESDDGEEDDDDDKDDDEIDDDDDDDDDDDEEEISKIDEQDDTERGGDVDEESKKEEADELYRDVNINQGKGLPLSQDIEDSHVILTPVNPDGQQESSTVSSQFVTSMLNPTSDAGMESIFATALSPVAPLQTSTPIMTPSTIATITTISHAQIPPTTIPSEVLQNLPTFDSVFRFDDRLKSLEANFSEYIQTNPFAEATDRLRDSYQRENDEFLRTIDENMKRIIKEQVKGQVKEQVSRIIPRIKQFVNAQLEAKVLTRSSHSSRTSYTVAADLSEMELKKILIEKMEGNKSIQRSDEQRNLYKALVEAYEADKIILDTYRETVTLKRRRDDESDNDEGPSAGLDRGSKRRREGKEPESASAPLQTAIRSASRVDTLTPELLVGPTFDLMKGSCISLIELEYHLEKVYKATTNQLDWVNPKGQQYPHNLLQPLPLIPDNQGRRLIPFAHFINNDSQIYYICNKDEGNRLREYQFYGFAVNRESALDVYSKRRIIAVTDLKIVEWHSYKHLDWITICRDDDKLYKFKEGDFKRLRLQDIEDMLLLLVQGKLSNLTVEERFAFNVSLRIFTRSIVI
uniref:Uncharacterized protein n=1 Tax=Tanacetum cinerariifolium TaxID=118510 RepID=A0A6L2LSM6_TANCI|nr:hypothetical protein [Tanacetum cinerariifolium]